MKRKTYRTSRLILRPYRESDYAAWVQAHQFAPPKKSKYDWVPKPKMKFGRSDFRKIILNQNRLTQKDHTYVWPIFLKQTGELIGSVDIYVINRGVLQVANLGYRVNNLYWRKGYGEEAVSAIVRGAFKDLKLNRLEAVIDNDNKPSLKFAKAIGFRREGIRRKYYYQNKKWDDQIVYVGIREDFGLPILHPK
ncbi:MAG: GNAT family N-acetyltransferase [Bdellovibrionales bacterium]